MSCMHERIEIAADVVRVVDEGVYMADVRVRCVLCRESFRWLGVPAGVSFRHPSVSPDGLELRAPLVLDEATS